VSEFGHGERSWWLGVGYNFKNFSTQISQIFADWVCGFESTPDKLKVI
jgi:hypothetical protein